MTPEFSGKDLTWRNIWIENEAVMQAGLITKVEGDRGRK